MEKGKLHFLAWPAVNTAMNVAFCMLTLKMSCCIMCLWSHQQLIVTSSTYHKLSEWGTESMRNNHLFIIMFLCSWFWLKWEKGFIHHGKVTLKIAVLVQERHKSIANALEFVFLALTYQNYHANIIIVIFSSLNFPITVICYFYNTNKYIHTWKIYHMSLLWELNSHCNRINFLNKYIHNRHSIGHSWGRGMFFCEYRV